jgi:hypothetical protein
MTNFRRGGCGTVGTTDPCLDNIGQIAADGL